MSQYSRYSKFPELRRFVELGGQHTKEGDEYLGENPKVYNQVLEYTHIHQIRRCMGESKVIHKPNSLRS
jgi:hypothetical protein